MDMMRKMAWLMAFAASGSMAQGVPAPIRASVSESYAEPLAKWSKDESKLEGGLVKDLVDAVGRQAGRPVSYVPLPRSRISLEVAAGRIDLRCYLSKEWVPKPELYEWSGILFVEKNVLVGKKSSPAPKAEGSGDGVSRAFEKIKGKKVGSVLGYAYPRLESIKASGDLEMEDASSEEANLDKLARGRIDFAIISKMSLDHYLKKKGEKEIESDGLLIDSHDIECAAPKESVGGKSLISALEKVKSSGELARILAKYKR